MLASSFELISFLEVMLGTLGARGAQKSAQRENGDRRSLAAWNSMRNGPVNGCLRHDVHHRFVQALQLELKPFRPMWTPLSTYYRRPVLRPRLTGTSTWQLAEEEGFEPPSELPR